MTKSEQLQFAVKLLLQQRWAALATVDEAGNPAASMVAYATDTGGGCLYLHLSTLAAHGRALQQHPNAALVISEGDSGHGDPQQLARLSLQGECRPLTAQAEDYAAAKQCYLTRLPQAAQLFDFSDFKLFQFTIRRLRYVGGFGQAYSYRGEEFQAQLSQAVAPSPN